MPLLPPTAALETHTILKQCILARAALAELKQAVELGGRHAASRYLKRLVELGVLKETTMGKDKLFIHPKLMRLLTQDSNEFTRYPTTR